MQVGNHCNNHLARLATATYGFDIVYGHSCYSVLML